MQKKTWKNMATLVLALMVFLLVGCSSSTEETKTDTSDATTQEGGKVEKIALLLPGTITDHGWNANAHAGLEKLKGEGYETAYTEMVVAANMEATFRNYAKEGYDLLIGHGGQFGDAALRVAADYPEKYFFVFGPAPDENAEMPDNMCFVDEGEFEGAYLAGVLAALTTESNVIGYVGGEDISTQRADKNAFIEGVASIDPAIDVQVIIAGTFEDSAKGKESALALIEQGADVLMHSADSTGVGVIEAAKEQEVYVIGYGTDQSNLAGEYILTSIIINIPDAIVQQLDRIEQGNFAGVYKQGLEVGLIALAPYGPSVPEEVRTQVDETEEQIISGEVEVTLSYE